MLPKLTQVQDTYQGQTVTVTKVEVDGEATLRLKDGLITDGTYIYRMIARADQTREIVVSIGNISVSYSLSAVYETFSQSYMSVVAENNPCVTIIFPTGTYYLYQVELDGNSVSSDLLEHIEEVSTKTDEAYEKAYQAMPKYTTCSSAGSATAKVTASITNFDTSLPAGMRVSVLMANANTAANPTLSVSGTPAYPILTSSGEAITADNLDQVSWPQNALVTFVFDGAHWRIDDSVALTKIDHILTEDLWSSNRNSFINLNDGVFNYGQGAFQWDGSQLHITGDVDASGTLHGAKIDGEELSIVANGEVEVTPTPEEDPELSYVVALLTTEPSSDDPDGTRTTYKGLALRADILKGSPGRLQSGCEIDLDPLDGSVGISGDQFFVALRNTETGHYQEFLAARTRGTEREFTVSGNVQVDGELTAKPKSQSRSIQTVSGITVGSLQVYTSAGFCAVTLELTSKTTLSDWTTIATGMPIPAVTWYDTMTNWENTYHRPYRVAVTTSGNLNIRYGAGSSSDATAYRISFVYPMAT